MYTQHNLKIAIVDDDPIVIEMMKDFFMSRFNNAIINTYLTGEKALKEIVDQPDLIVLDYHLDSVDPAALNGIQILTKLKDRMPDVPVIFCSGEEKAEIAVNTIKYGAYDYVVKNEGTFSRIEILVKNIITSSQVKKNLGTQKFFNRLLALIIAALIIWFFIRKMGS